MAKDKDGNEIPPGSTAAKYGASSRKALADAQAFGSDVVRPALQQAFPNMAAVDTGVREDLTRQPGARAAGTLVRGSLATVPAVATDVARSVGLASKAIFDPWLTVGKQYAQGLIGTSDVVPPVAASVPAASARTPPAAGSTAANVRAARDAALPPPVVQELTDAQKMAAQNLRLSDRMRAEAAQQDSDRALGLLPSAGAAPSVGRPTDINVERQPDGTLSFSGVGGAGQQGMRYSGQPDWTSQRGGAGQGNAISLGGWDLAEQNKRMEPVVKGLTDAAMRQTIMNRPGDASTRALADIMNQERAGAVTLTTSQTQAETARRGQDVALKGHELGFEGQKYSTDVGAKTAADEQEVAKRKIAATLVAGQAGDPEAAMRVQGALMDYMVEYGEDPRTGKAVPEATLANWRKNLASYAAAKATPTYGMPPAN